MKNFFIFLCLLLYSCQSPSNQPSDSSASSYSDTSHSISSKDSVISQTQNADYLIIPGRQIGQTYINEDASLLFQRLGKPDFSDAAMGKAWLIWYGKRDVHNNKTELDVYTTYKDSTMRGKAVKEIRTTSSAFSFQDIHVYSNLDSIRAIFPGLKFIEKYKAKDGREIAIYDDQPGGIAFEAVWAGNEQICTGIIVHQPGIAVSDVYIRLQE